MMAKPLAYRIGGKQGCHGIFLDCLTPAPGMILAQRLKIDPNGAEPAGKRHVQDGLRRHEMAIGCDLTINFPAKASDLSLDGWPRARGKVRAPAVPQRPVDQDAGEQCRMERRQA